VVQDMDGCCEGGDPGPGERCAEREPRSVPLSQLRDGDCGTVCECDLQGHDGALLRAMGLCPNAQVRLCRGGGRMIVAVGGAERGESRIGIARELADKILVSPGR
jgi:hypothetical protein